MKDLIKKEHQYQADIAEVWKAITSADDISAWFIKADFKPEVGYNYTFTHEHVSENSEKTCTVISGKVLEADPVHNLVYTWEVSGTGVETTVRWQLQENEQGTLVTLIHSGISNYQTQEMITKMFTNFSNGWENCITNLEKYLIEAHHAKPVK